MKKRKFGNTGLEVSEIGFGAWQIGDECRKNAMCEADALSLVAEAIDSGINFFDTAPGYGQGRSEELLGKALKGKRDRVVINTKFGHSADGKTDFSHTEISGSVEESLKRLRTDYLDSIILHNPPFELLNGRSPQYGVFEKLKEQGKIRAYGASVDSSREMFEVIRTTESRVMEVLFNIFHQETAKAFEEAKARDIGLIIKVPLDSGWLSGKYNSRSQFGDIRSRWSGEIIARRAGLVDKIAFLATGSTTLLQAALRFILSYDAVSTIIPGVKTSGQLKANISVSGTPLAEEHIRALTAFYRTELEKNPLPW